VTYAGRVGWLPYSQRHLQGLHLIIHLLFHVRVGRVCHSLVRIGSCVESLSEGYFAPKWYSRPTGPDLDSAPQWASQMSDTYS
jgi:hypothetical protein